MAASRAGKIPPPREIEGDSVVLERRPRKAGPTARFEPEPLNDNRADPPPFPEHRRSKPDFLYPGAVRWRTASREAPVPRSPVKRYAGIGLAIAAALGVVWFGMIWQKPSAPVAALPAKPAFVLSETATTILIRGEAHALFIEGRIRNTSNHPAAAPAVVVRLGERPYRTFRAIRSTLAPGASAFFRSTLAIPSVTSGTKAVLSLEAAAEGNS